MALLFVSALAGYMLSEALRKKSLPTERLESEHTTSFKVKEGVGALSLPSCNLIAVQLGPSDDKRKIALSLYLENGDVPQETFKPISDFKTKKYVKMPPTYYPTGITLESKAGIPITAYYSSVL